MLIPLTVYLYQRDQHIAWLVCGGLLTLGAFATGSRTAAIMLVVLLVTYVWIKRPETTAAAPDAHPAGDRDPGGDAGHARHLPGDPPAELPDPGAVPGEPAPAAAGSRTSGPSLSEWSREPFLGQGFGTRVVTHRARSGRRGLRRQVVASARRSSTTSGSPRCSRSAPWACSALLWLFCRAIRRLAQRARSDPGPDGWLATALAASLTAYAVGMLTFDAFAFIQVTFLAFVMLGFSVVVARDTQE